MNLPSEVLNQAFVLPDEPVAQQATPQNEFKIITTHAVMVGNIGLLLPSNEVSELIDKLSVCRLPNTPPWFSGVASVRGNMVPVFDLHELLGIEYVGSERRVIIIGSGDSAAAFWVDQMPCMVMVTSENYMNSIPPLPQLIKDYAQEYFLKDGQIWISWDIEAFFRNIGERLWSE